MEGFFPILVDVKGKSCAVIGGGKVAERRIASLLQAGAAVKVISPEFNPAIAGWIRQGAVKGIQREYRPADIEDAFLVIAATDSAAVNDQVCADAREKGLLVNRAERPETGNFIVPSVVRRGKLVIAVSTLGASPSVAAQIRREIEASIKPEYETVLDFLSEFRLKVQELVKDTAERQNLFRTVLKLDLIEKVRAGTFEEWKSQVMKRLTDDPDGFGRQWEQLEELEQLENGGGQSCETSL